MSDAMRNSRAHRFRRISDGSAAAAVPRGDGGGAHLRPCLRLLNDSQRDREDLRQAQRGHRLGNREYHADRFDISPFEALPPSAGRME